MEALYTVTLAQNKSGIANQFVAASQAPGKRQVCHAPRSARLHLPNDCAIRCIAAWRDVIDLERHDIAATKFTINGHVEYSQVTQPMRERCSVRHVNMTISLVFLAPNLVRAAVEGRLPRGINAV